MKINTSKLYIKWKCNKLILQHIVPCSPQALQMMQINILNDDVKSPNLTHKDCSLHLSKAKAHP